MVAMLSEVHCRSLCLLRLVIVCSRQAQQTLKGWVQGLLERFSAHHELWVASLAAGCAAGRARESGCGSGAGLRAWACLSAAHNLRRGCSAGADSTCGVGS